MNPLCRDNVQGCNSGLSAHVASLTKLTDAPVSNSESCLSPRRPCSFLGTGGDTAWTRTISAMSVSASSCSSHSPDTSTWWVLCGPWVLLPCPCWQGCLGRNWEGFVLHARAICVQFFCTCCTEWTWIDRAAECPVPRHLCTVSSGVETPCWPVSQHWHWLGFLLSPFPQLPFLVLRPW